MNTEKLQKFILFYLSVILVNECACASYQTYYQFNFYYYIVIIGLFFVNVIATIVLICNGYIPKELQCTAVILLFFLPYFSTLVIICIRRSRIAQMQMQGNAVIVIQQPNSQNQQPQQINPQNNNYPPPQIQINQPQYPQNRNPPPQVQINQPQYPQNNNYPPQIQSNQPYPPYNNNFQGYSNINQNPPPSQNGFSAIQVNSNQQINYNNPYQQAQNLPPVSGVDIEKMGYQVIEPNNNPPGPAYLYK